MRKLITVFALIFIAVALAMGSLNDFQSDCENKYSGIYGKEYQGSARIDEVGIPSMHNFGDVEISISKKEDVLRGVIYFQDKWIRFTARPTGNNNCWADNY